MSDAPSVSAALRRQPALGPSLQQVRPVTLVDPFIAAEQWVGRVGALVGGALIIWGLVRVVLRPWFDDLTLASWKRKRPDVEAFMRDEIFRTDLAERRANKELLDRAMIVASANADSIGNLARDVARIGLEQNAMHTLLAGIPRIDAGMENIVDAIAEVSRDVREANAISREHGERIASLSALIGEETPGRRHYTRRATDPHLLDHTPEDEGPNT